MVPWWSYVYLDSFVPKKLTFLEGFTGGGANNPYYDGQALADEHEVVVVTIKSVLPILHLQVVTN
jgi:Carboxylesterase type B